MTKIFSETSNGIHCYNIDQILDHYKNVIQARLHQYSQFKFKLFITEVSISIKYTNYIDENRLVDRIKENCFFEIKFLNSENFCEL